MSEVLHHKTNNFILHCVSLVFSVFPALAFFPLFPLKSVCVDKHNNILSRKMELPIAIDNKKSLKARINDIYVLKQ